MSTNPPRPCGSALDVCAACRSMVVRTDYDILEKSFSELQAKHTTPKRRVQSSLAAIPALCTVGPFFTVLAAVGLAGAAGRHVKRCLLAQ